MQRNWLTRAAACTVAASAFALGGALLACSPSETEKMDLGETIDDPAGGAMPTDPAQMQMTEEERRAQEAAQEEATERSEFEASGQGGGVPTPP